MDEPDVETIALRLLAEKAEDRLEQMATAAKQAHQLAEALRKSPCRENPGIDTAD